MSKTFENILYTKNVCVAIIIKICIIVVERKASYNSQQIKPLKTIDNSSRKAHHGSNPVRQEQEPEATTGTV